MTARRSLLLGGIAAALVLLVSGNALVSMLLPGSRLDLTQERLYTLSDGTRQALTSLEEPITLRLFFSDRLGREVPVYGAYAQRVRDLLSEYKSIAGDKLKIEFLNPEPFSAVEDRAVAYGLQGAPLDQAGEQVYFGLVGTNSTDDEEVIASLAPERERFLAYDLTRMVTKLARPSQRVVGMISSLPIDFDPALAQQGGGDSWAVYDQLRQFYEVRNLGGEVTSFPPEMNLLVLVHPDKLSDRTLYAIDQFVMRGGKLLVFIDPNSEAAALRGRMNAMRGMPPGETVSTLDRLLPAYGVRMVKDVVAADNRNARRVQVGAGTQTRVQAAFYLAWLSLPDTSLNRSDAVTGELNLVNVATAGVLEPVAEAGTQFEPLMTTSPIAMKLPVDRVRGTQPDILAIQRSFQSEGAPLTIAARITGPVKSAFPDGPPKAEGQAEQAQAEQSPAEQTPAAHLAQSTSPASIIVMADTDMLENRFWAQIQEYFGQRVATPTANNADFVLNAVDNLLGGSALASLRSRGVSDRPFTLVQALQQDAENRFRTKEQELQDKVKETERKLAELSGRDAAANAQANKPNQGGGAAGAVLTPEQAREIETFRAELIQTRAELRAVQRSLREDIDALQSMVRFVNIALIPLAVAVIAVLVGVLHRRRRNRTGRRSAALA